MPNQQSQNGIVIGHRDISPDAPSHIAGVHEGNWPVGSRRRRRARGADTTLNGTARRSTGISPSGHDVLDPRMPKLTPP